MKHIDIINLVAEIDDRLAMVEILEEDNELHTAYGSGIQDALRSLREWVVEEDEEDCDFM